MTTPQPGNPGPPERAANVHAVRPFTRFYTQRMGILERRLLDSPYSVAQARVLYEIAHHETATSSELASELDLDAGYLSRIVKGFEEKGLVVRQTSKADGRRMPLSLTDAGRQAFALLNSRSSAKNGAMLDALSPADERRLVEAMATIEALLGAEHPRRAPFILRPPQSGDIGWTVFRQGQLYKQEERDAEAQAKFELAAKLDPSMAAPHFQLYNLFRRDDRERAKQELEEFQRIKKLQEETGLDEDVNWSFYSELYDPIEPPASAPTVGGDTAFETETIEVANLESDGAAGTVALQLDGTGPPDALAWRGEEASVVRFGSDEFRVGRLDASGVRHAAAGDLNNDGLADVCIAGPAKASVAMNAAGVLDEAMTVADGDWLRRHRRHALLVCAAISALITPADVISMIAMLLPLYALYEFGLLLVHFAPARRVAEGRVLRGESSTSENEPSDPSNPTEAVQSESGTRPRRPLDQWNVDADDGEGDDSRT